MNGANALDRQRQAFNRFAIAPSLIVLVLVAFLPAMFLLGASFTPYQLASPASLREWSAPLRNYQLLAEDSRFTHSLIVQAKLSFWTVLFQVVFGLVTALLLDVPSRFVEIARTFLLIPMVLPPIVVAVIWKLLYTPDISPIYYAAEFVHVTLPSLTSSVDFALVSIILADTWQWFPFTFLMVLAALQTIPQEYAEAALIDGASRTQVFLYVTLPFIAPILTITALFRLIDSIKAFPLIFLLTGGGPGNLTEVTNYYAYLVAFDFNEIGYSSAVTVVLLFLVAAVTLAVTRLSRRDGAPA